MDLLLRIVQWLNFLVSAAVVLIGLGAFFFRRAVVLFLMALAVIVVGPVENWLIGAVASEQLKELIDQGTSLTGVLLLLAAMLLYLRDHKS
jgi:hypothetical protein